MAAGERWRLVKPISYWVRGCGYTIRHKEGKKAFILVYKRCKQVKFHFRFADARSSFWLSLTGLHERKFCPSKLYMPLSCTRQFHFTTSLAVLYSCGTSFCGFRSLRFIYMVHEQKFLQKRITSAKIYSTGEIMIQITSRFRVQKLVPRKLEKQVFYNRSRKIQKNP